MSKELFLKLYKAERESEVSNIIDMYGMGKDEYWIPYGNKDSNFSVIGNQASNAERALIEKLTNSVDAVLTRRCYEENINPRGEEAPKNSQEALKRFFDVKDGNTSNIDNKKEKEISDNIMLIATNKDCESTPRNSKYNPNFIIFDSGEGQSPKMLPHTLLSLLNGNKKGIPFTQGNYNQGGSGALMYCGDTGYCLVISKRHVNIPERFKDKNDETIELWGWTLIRKEIRQGYRDPIYTYYAPNGQVPSFKAEELELLPKMLDKNQSKEYLEYDGPCTAYVPYERKVSCGTAIKLYNYRVDKKGPIISHIKYDLASYIYDTYLPIKFVDCRKNKSSNSVVFSGFKKIIEDDMSKNHEDKNGLVHSKLELDFVVEDQRVDVTIYCCNKRSSGELTASKLVENSRPIKFCLGQQFQGGLTAKFLNSAGLGIIQDLIIIIVEFPNIKTEFKSDLFATDRERLYDKKPKREIEKKLKDYIENCQELRDFSDYIFKAEIKDEKKNNSTIKEAVEEWIQKDPTIMSALMGSDIPKTELKNKGSSGDDDGEVKPKKPRGKTKEKEAIETSIIPTFFSPLLKINDNGIYQKPAVTDTPFRIRFETDAEDCFFKRTELTGDIKLYVDGQLISGFTKSIHNGIATVILDKKVTGSKIASKELVFEVYCDGELLFTDTISINILEKEKEESGANNSDTGALGLPPHQKLTEENWLQDMDSNTAVLLKNVFGKDTYFINADNKHLKAKKQELHGKQALADFYEEIFTYAMLFSAMSIKNNDVASTTIKDSDEFDINKQIELATKTYARVFFITDHLTSEMKKKLKI